MVDASTLFFDYVEAKRHLWNAYFSNKVRSVMDDRVRMFAEIERLLFQSLVAVPVGHDDFDASILGKDPIDWMAVVLSTQLDRAEVMVAGASHPRAWKKAIVDRSEFGQMEFLLVDAFDWHPTGFPSFPFIEVAANSSRGERWLVHTVDVEQIVIAEAS